MIRHSTAKEQTVLVSILDREFAQLIESLQELTSKTPSNLLYRSPPAITVGENIVRSAGVVEQTFGGIASNLWDDPFEWTLPETLSSGDLIIEYFSEVETTRVRTFSSFDSDQTLFKLIALPSGDSCRLIELLVQTLVRASEYRGRAVATLKMLSDVGT
jgi:hypothetical protein